MTAAPLLSRTDLAHRFAVTTRCVDRWRQLHADFPKPVKIGRTPRWRPEDVEAWLESRREGGAS